MKHYKLTYQRHIVKSSAALSLIGSIAVWRFVLLPMISVLGFGWVVHSIATALALFTLIYGIYRIFTRKWTLKLVIHEDKAEPELEVNGIRLQPEDIAGIYIDGYFKSTVGIRLHKQKLVSPRLCFRFAGHEDEAIHSLKFWTHQHGISWEAKPFKRWV
ncbi:hypothetical protein [Paenibacillus senegalensis]|uniref:hypothetical protein n=1 Tax=Paenibacillus senegalensis TaxID=1465766 RepID=UPI00047448A6|nr:hypothetical protein [Paenibacillus senegalensis]